jgi:HPt (histidine-containing phosphotransfer) domain-containing protein
MGSYQPRPHGETGGEPHGADDRVFRVKRMMEHFLDTVQNQPRPHPEWVEIAHAAADRFVEMTYAAGALNCALEGSRIGLALQELEQDARPLREVRVLIRGLRMALDRAWARQFPGARPIPGLEASASGYVPGSPDASGAIPAAAEPVPADEIPTDGTFSYLGTPGFPFDPELTQIFLTEVGEQIPAAERILLALETRPEDPQRVNDLFRVLHTIKGNAGFLGLREFMRLVHTMEQYLEPFRNRNAPSAELGTEPLLEGVDVLSRLLANLQPRSERIGGSTDSAEPEPAGWQPLVVKLQAACRG